MKKKNRYIITVQLPDDKKHIYVQEAVTQSDANLLALEKYPLAVQVYTRKLESGEND